MPQSLYQSYADVELQIKELTKVRESYREEILKGMLADGNDKLQNEVGSFTVSKLKKWTYPPEVETLGTQYKIAKIQSENEKTATYTEEPSLRFTLAKE
jgi:hypothetical protein